MVTLNRRRLLQLTAANGVLFHTALWPTLAKAAPSLALKPLIFSHRGASALRPEHTLAAYGKAIIDGADYIEPDLVPTKDGHLIARHESNITDTTDVAHHTEFSSRRRKIVMDGKEQEGWFTTDFTLAEIKTLRACERLPTIRPLNTRYDGWFEIPTLEEVIDFVAAASTCSNRLIGLIPEIKNPTHFRKLGFSIEDTLLKILDSHLYTSQAPVEIQCFEDTALRYLRQKIGYTRPHWKLMFLLGGRQTIPADILAVGGKTTFGDLMTPAALKDIRQFAEAIGPSNDDLIPKTQTGQWGNPSSLIEDAHATGLLVHSYTCRPENRFLPLALRDQAGDNARNIKGSIAEIRRYLELGLDGFFTDDPAIGRLAIAET
ncbi:MAG: glycerophosphodiester phosphodiesterase family protein [Zymomonas mobilis subsp. pomaceae]|uniref:glycerophosphodiester phosphodiesterase n=1 Tax=Zymomonas mobilis subsp. pomaceae (strain ATCC 29192 / DSM 22645 / JCM 10191 / CCUG 17912 / NBRC 13757 / NCIMB 11200 / NRRL B-4491 / Barker I) TaxID=579138 RepID=F8ESZ3_ZYMMT|nr:glycerophosphodiester phosphodiesterase family protein [Zymomonas mobilis]AEI37897.1 glycerophosphoryl diester phosphodiesterase [Zymomonas mobilis subsp. pomaceae ATCC 29192]MDX5949263.1 glycerophosphodiester phosphodiesterase family protein [Zymomonas mobilis subsp. pomaceae]GEB89732.1 glycerophosphoryl diester phosphodiesterase [Zymomonas mobilis subsp. pomaceae]